MGRDGLENSVMKNVIDLAERRERWTITYESPVRDFRVKVSNHGRMSFEIPGSEKSVILSFFDSVTLLTNASKDMNCD